MATGRKTVTVGQVIDPNAWGNPVWDQSVQTFASAADRATQFPAPLAGAVTWLDDVRRLEYWTGTKWDPLGQTAGVQSGSSVVTLSGAGIATIGYSPGPGFAASPAPVVTATLASAATALLLYIDSGTAPSRTGFNVVVKTTAGAAATGSVRVYWVATGAPNIS